MKSPYSLAHWVYIGWSVYALFHGLSLFWQTSGMVQGSEFGMLIMLAHQVSILMVWLGLYVVHRQTRDAGAG